jgi:hypothetical protein
VLPISTVVKATENISLMIKVRAVKWNDVNLNLLKHVLVWVSPNPVACQTVIVLFRHCEKAIILICHIVMRERRERSLLEWLHSVPMVYYALTYHI